MNRRRHNKFTRCWAILASTLLFAFVFTAVGIAQTNTPPKSKLSIKDDRDDEQPPSVGEMIEKQRILRQKKEYGEMLKRGDEALKLSEELETSFNKSESLSPQDLEKLAALEKVVGKIRNDLGGDNDNDKIEDSTGPENNARHDVISAFKFLRSSTVRLVDELKKSSRFSISVAAVESSNAVIRIARFSASRNRQFSTMNRAAVFLTIITLAAVAIHAQDEGEVVRVDSSLVVLNATITDLEGRPVAGLFRDRFSVLEDGVEQKIEFFSAEETPFAAVILIDTSGSMEGRVSMARAAAIRFLAGLRENDVSSIYNFDSKVTQVQEFSDLRDIDERVFELKARGMTALNDAIVRAAEELNKRAEKRRAIIVLSDGADTYSKRSADYALKAALNVDAVIYTVDMSAMDGGRLVQNIGVLKNYAEKTGGRFIATPGGAQMRQAFEQIVAELGTQYTIAYDPKNTLKDGKWRAIELRVARKNLYIRTRKGYNAPKSK